ncbi:MAG: hypothetical protein HC927_14015 [Deltaproteobacteria bacterium]|nr:hypothetical protein [Deltaproteobacteria bacterium]
MGGSQISGRFGDGYLDWLRALHPGSHGNADLCAHFFRRADALLGPQGTIGLIATNTIGQGDTRATGLRYLLGEREYVIYEAVRDLAWPGAGATVTVSIVHLRRGRAAEQAVSVRLHEPDAPRYREVAVIDSRLRAKPERSDPHKLGQQRQSELPRLQGLWTRASCLSPGDAQE